MRRKVTKNQYMQGTKTRKIAMLAALKEYLGVISAACDKAGIERQTHYRWMQSDPRYKKQVEAIDERPIDLAELKLMSLINDKNAQAIIFYLKTKGRKRGYSEIYGLEHSGEITEKHIHINDVLKAIREERVIDVKAK